VNEDRFRQARDKQSKLLSAKISKLVETMLVDEKLAMKGDEEQQTEEVGLSKQMFMSALQNPEVRKLLSDMDISDTDHMLLFDVLDADGSGNLDVKEIVQGLVQVQAPARALDIVAVRLGMRAMQRQLKEQLTEQKESFDRLTAELSQLRKDQKQQGSALKRLTSKEVSRGRDVVSKFKSSSSTGISVDKEVLWDSNSSAPAASPPSLLPSPDFTSPSERLLKF
jgi:hypothetical protein